MNLDNERNKELNENIIFLIEKLSQIDRVLLWKVAVKDNVSPAQVKILDYLSLNKHKYIYPSELSKEFDLSKATLTDSINNLCGKGLLIKTTCENDKRKTRLLLTDKGKQIASNISGRWDIMYDILNDVPTKDREVVFKVFVRMLNHLFEEGLIQKARICLTCKNCKLLSGSNEEKLYHCQVTNKKMSAKDININCKEHIQ